LLIKERAVKEGLHEGTIGTEGHPARYPAAVFPEKAVAREESTANHLAVERWKVRGQAPPRAERGLLA
jgi:hypothetical protein